MDAIWDESDIALWQTRLGYVPAEVARHTLDATTQMVELEENHSSYTTMKNHFKKRFPGLGCRRVQDVAFCDLFQPTGDVGASKRGYKYYLPVALNRAKTVHGFGLKSKDAAPAALKQFFVDVCVPELVVTDGWGWGWGWGVN